MYEWLKRAGSHSIAFGVLLVGFVTREELRTTWFILLMHVATVYEGSRNNIQASRPSVLTMAERRTQEELETVISMITR